MVDFALLSLFPFALAVIFAVPQVRTALKPRGMAWALSAAMAVLFALFLVYLPTITDSGPQSITFEWVPQLGLMLSWYLDGLSLVFALVVTGIGVAVYLFAGHYLEDQGEQETGRFYMLLLGFTGAMLTLVLAGNVLTLFIAWELTSVFSFTLIGFKGGKGGAKYREEAAEARRGAMRALIITGAGGLALLVGLVLAGVAANQINGAGLFDVAGFQLATLLQTPLADHPWYIGIAILIMLGCFTKSAQFPFHFWLPGAMSAPSPASAYLHSATMVKAGVYLLARMYPVLGDTSFWLHVLMGIGLTTMFIGALFAVRKRDLKGLLAYSTVSWLGTLVALIGLPNSDGIKAAIVGILGHALYKATFFLLAGSVEHSTGTRNLDNLGGLRALMPGAAAIAAVVGVSMAGYPPMLGYVAKEVLLDAMLPVDPLTLLPIVITFVSAVLTGVAAFLFVWDVFFRPAPAHAPYFSPPERATAHHEETAEDDHAVHDDHAGHFHAPPPAMHYGPGLLALLSIVLGLFVAPIIIPLITPAVPKEFSLYLIPPDALSNPAFLMSLTIMVLAPLTFAARGLWLHLPDFPLPHGVRLYDGVIGLVNAFGDLLLRSQNGKLRHYLVAIMGSVFLFILFAEFSIGNVLQLEPLRLEFFNVGVDALRIVLLVLALGAALASILFRKHLLAALAMGVMGYAVGGLFLLEPAPDVALVQVLVETLGTVLIILMITRISVPQREKMIEASMNNSNFSLLRDVVISSAIGISVGLFALTAVSNRVLATRINEPIASWHITHAYEETGVTDVVAAILADFRGVDTLLEITVFAMAALGVLTLLTRPHSNELLGGTDINTIRKSLPTVTAETEDELECMQDERARSRLSTPLTRTVSVLVLPFALLLAFSHVLYGGVGPGDGFTAGVISGLTIALWYVVFGYFEARERLSWFKPGRIAAIGLTVATANALFPMLFGEPFFAHITFGDGSGPAGTHLASTLFFELGIFLTVSGGTGVIMEAIAHPRETEGI